MGIFYFRSHIFDIGIAYIKIYRYYTCNYLSYINLLKQLKYLVEYSVIGGNRE